MNSRFKPFSLFWPSLSLLERLTFVVTVLLLLEWLVAMTGLIPTRSLAAIAAGLLLFTLSSLSLVCVGCLVVRHLLRWRRIGAGSAVVLTGGALAASPAAAIMIQLSGQ